MSSWMDGHNTKIILYFAVITTALNDELHLDRPEMVSVLSGLKAIDYETKNIMPRYNFILHYIYYFC